jgi:hypothetical protein
MINAKGISPIDLQPEICTRAFVYNIKRVIALLGVPKLITAMQT